MSLSPSRNGRDPAKRKELEQRIHPLVRARLAGIVGNGEWGTGNGERRTQNSKLKTRNSQLPTIEIIPLLFECHWEADYDIILCVSSPRSLQVERMTSRRGYTEEQAESRLAAQLPVEEKAARSDYVIENNGSAEDLMGEAKKLVAWLKGRGDG